MRIIYIDEAGTSSKEPVAVVSAAIIDPDRQWKIANTTLKQIIEKYVPQDLRKNFVIHGKELMSGVPGFKGPEYSIDYRLGLISETFFHATELNIPLCFAYSNKKFKTPEMSDKEANQRSHVYAYLRCIAFASKYVELNCPGELAIVVAEQNDAMRGILQRVPLFVREFEREIAQDPALRDLIPIKSIIGPTYFSSKKGEAMLQIADVCAFTLRRYASGDKFGDKLMESLFRGKIRLRHDPRNVAIGQFGVWPIKDISGSMVKMPKF